MSPYVKRQTAFHLDIKRATATILMLDIADFAGVSYCTRICNSTWFAIKETLCQLVFGE